MLVMVVFFIAFRWIHLSTPLIRLFLFVLILLLMPTLNFLPVWFALSLLRFRLPSQLYVFMPPNLGGFFMVRSYYPSECHADYFDFERIEALKPAIEACGISTLSQ